MTVLGKISEANFDGFAYYIQIPSNSNDSDDNYFDNYVYFL